MAVTDLKDLPNALHFYQIAHDLVAKIHPNLDLDFTEIFWEQRPSQGGTDREKIHPTLCFRSNGTSPDEGPDHHSRPAWGKHSAGLLPRVEILRFLVIRQWYVCDQCAGDRRAQRCAKELLKVQRCHFMCKPCAKVARIVRFVLFMMLVESVTCRFCEQESCSRCTTTFRSNF